MRKAKDLVGETFGSLTVIKEVEKYIHPSGSTTRMWECKCSCNEGTVKNYRADSLKTGKSLSCGCIRKSYPLTHGMTGTLEFNIWRGMKYRCNNSNFSGYKYYGGKGIKVCERWEESFENFYQDMGKIPSENHSIERIKSNEDYTPENCKWATKLEQGRNTSFNHNIEYKGEIKCLSEWAEFLDMKYSTLSNRIQRGWTVERAFTSPINTKHRKL